MPHLQSSLALAPDDQVVLETLASAYEAMGQRQQALQWVAKAVAKGNSKSDLALDPVL